MTYRLAILAIAALLLHQSNDSWAQEQLVSSSTQNNAVEAKWPSPTYEAQQVVVRDTVINTHKGPQTPALFVNVPESEYDIVMKAWENSIKRKTRNKPVSQGGLLFLSQTTVNEIADAPMDVYYHLMSKDAGVRLVAGFDLGGTFLSAEAMPQQYEAARNFIRAFAIKQYQTSVDRVLDAEKKKLNQFQGDLDKLHREKKRLESLIADRTQDIREFDRDISSNEGKVKAKDAEIMAANEQLAKLPEGPYQESQKKAIKTIEKDRKKIENENRNMRQKTINYKGDIEQAQRDLKQNEASQPAAAKLVDDQRLVVDYIKTKLTNIK